jgi:hypothetical protein
MEEKEIDFADLSKKVKVENDSRIRSIIYDEIDILDNMIKEVTPFWYKWLPWRLRRKRWLLTLFNLTIERHPTPGLDGVLVLRKKDNIVKMAYVSYELKEGKRETT